MSVTLTKKNIIVGTDNQIQSRYGNDPEGTIYLSTDQLTPVVPDATSSVAGKVKLGSDTVQTEAAQAVSSTQNRTYAVQVNSSGQEVVNVPWTGATVDTTAGSESVSDGTNTVNVVTRDTAQNITGLKTLVVDGDNSLILKQGGSARKSTLQILDTAGNEVGFFQYHPSNDQIVFGVDAATTGHSNTQLALRTYASGSGNAYSVLMPKGSNKKSAFGSGNLNMPLGVDIGGTKYTADANGVITLPGGGGGTQKYVHHLYITTSSGSSRPVFLGTVVTTSSTSLTTVYEQNTYPASSDPIYQLFDNLGLMIDSATPTWSKMSYFIANQQSGQSGHLYLRPGFGFYLVEWSCTSTGAVSSAGNATNLSQGYGSVCIYDNVETL